MKQTGGQVGAGIALSSTRINALQYAKMFESAGFSKEQAESITGAFHEVLNERLATKADLQSGLTATASDLRSEMKGLGVELRSEMKELGAELRSEMKELGVELRSDMKDLGGELRSEMKDLGGELRSEMKLLESRITIRLGGMMAVWAGLIIASVKLL